MPRLDGGITYGYQRPLQTWQLILEYLRGQAEDELAQRDEPESDSARFRVRARTSLRWFRLERSQTAVNCSQPVYGLRTAGERVTNGVRRFEDLRVI